MKTEFTLTRLSEHFRSIRIYRSENGSIERVAKIGKHTRSAARLNFFHHEDVPVGNLFNSDFKEITVKNVMTDRAWLFIATELRGHQLLGSNDDPLFPINQRDLPVELAEGRLGILQRQMGDSDRQAWIELNEIIMAAAHGRPPRKALFSRRSRKAVFAEALTLSRSKIQNIIDFQRDLEQVAQQAYESARDKPHWEAILQADLCHQELKEVRYLTDRFFGDFKCEVHDELATPASHVSDYAQAGGVRCPAI